MQNTSLLYKQILASEPHWFETAVVVGETGDLITETGDKILFGGTAILVARAGAENGYQEERLFSVRTSTQMFTDDVTIGTAVSQEIEIKMLKPAGDLAGRMGAIVPYVRVCNETDKSEWLQQGVFFIDTREISDNESDIVTVTIHGYDAMLKTEQYWQDTGHLNWGSGTVSDVDMVSEIARIIDVTVDPRTWDIMTGNYRIPMPTNYTLREVLCYIASMYLGGFIMTETGQLRLVSLLELPAETNLLINEIGDYIVFGQDRIIV